MSTFLAHVGNVIISITKINTVKSQLIAHRKFVFGFILASLFLPCKHSEAAKELKQLCLPVHISLRESRPTESRCASNVSKCSTQRLTWGRRFVQEPAMLVKHIVNLNPRGFTMSLAITEPCARLCGSLHEKWLLRRIALRFGLTP